MVSTVDERLMAEATPERAVIYLDNAATSWPKPAVVAQAVQQAFEVGLGNPGRAGHRFAIAAGQLVVEARESLAELFGVQDPGRIVFTRNATEAVNTALFGLLQPGQHVVTSAVEHNAVMRPLRALEACGLEVTTVPCAADGTLDPTDVRRALRRSTRLIVTTHASNVLGTLMPIAEVAAIAREAGIPYLLDAAQTAGAVPLAIENIGIDLVAFSGHKGLFGPMGTGGLYIREGLDVAPRIYGGTGSLSELDLQPDFLPDRLESGTLNVHGLVGLTAGVRFLLQTGVAQVRAHEQGLVQRFLVGMRDIGRARVYGPADAERRIGVVSFRVDGSSCSDVALALERDHGILCRAGLHCAPAAHRTAGTFPEGTVRFGFGLFSRNEEVDTALQAIRQIAAASH